MSKLFNHDALVKERQGITTQSRNFLLAAIGAVLLAVLLGFFAGKSAGVVEGTAQGYKDGYGEGARSGWERGVVAATQEAYWMGAFDACAMVFDAAGWEYIYVNPQAGGGTISREYFCRDNGDYSGTPVLDIPYVESTEGSN